MRRPLLPVALSYAGGILLGRWWRTSPEAVAGAAFTVLVVAASWERWRPRLLLPLWFLLGWVHLLCVTVPLSPHDLRQHFDGAPVLARVRGSLVGEPVVRRGEGERADRRRTTVILRCENVSTNAGWQPAEGRLVVQLPERLPAGYHAGTRVEVYGVLRRPAGPTAEGLFDWGAFLRNRRIWFELVTERLADWRNLDAGRRSPGWPARFGTWARATLALGLPVEDERVDLLRAMALGWRTALTDEVAEPFMRTGTMHLFAISGLHIALVAGILVTLLRVARVPRGACALLALPALWFYVAVTGWQASAVRASIMMSVVVCGWSLKRPGDLFNSLCAAGLIILVWDPLQLFQASFQLSFFVVLSLALWMPVFEGWVQGVLKVDPLLPPELAPRGRRALNTALHWGLGSAAVSLAAWLGSLPLIARYFHLFTPVNLVANLAMVPLGGLAITSCLGSLLTAAWAPPLAVLFNHAAWFWMTGMIALGRHAAEWPWAFRYVAAPAGWQIVVYYTALIGTVGGRLWQAGRRRWLGVAILLLLAACWIPRWCNRHLTTVTVLPMQGGAAIWVDRPGAARDVLVDGGDARGVQRLTLPFLRSRGVNRLPGLVLTHGDVRHTGGAAGLAAELPVEQVAIGPSDFRSPSYRSFVRSLAATNDAAAFPRGIPRLRRVKSGDAVAGWRVVYPWPTIHFPRADDQPLVLRGVIGGVPFLLLSDLGAAGQEALLRSSEDLAAKVVIAGVPAGEKPLQPALFNRIQPSVVIFCDARWPAAKRAPPELVRRLREEGCEVFSTALDGAITLELGPHGAKLRTMRGRGMRIDVPPPPLASLGYPPAGGGGSREEPGPAGRSGATARGLVLQR